MSGQGGLYHKHIENMYKKSTKIDEEKIIG
jgi:hypothetical protein